MRPAAPHLIAIRYSIAGVLWIASAFLYGSHAQADSLQAWEKPRALSDFQALLEHSPFSLPTAEESSPLSDRYALTGIVTSNGEEQVFVFDRTDQSRTILTHTPNTNNMSLVALVREGNNPAQKATIRVGNDTGTIAFLEASPQQTVPTFPGFPGAGRPGGMQLPPMPQRPGFMGSNFPPGMMQPNRHIIRRPMINPPPSQPVP